MYKFRGLTPAKAQLAPQVSGLTKTEDGAVATTRALTNALIFASHQFNVVRNMSDLQLGYLADDLLVLYWHWKFDEFLLVLREGIRQNWGKTYDRFDPPTMHEWCKAYAAARELQIEHEASQGYEDHKKQQRKPKPSPLSQHPQFGADYAGARQQAEALNDAELRATGKQYEALAGSENEFITAVLLEVHNERRAAHYLARIGQAIVGDEKDFATYAVEVQQERRAREKNEDRAVELAFLQGDRAAAGLPAQPAPGLYENLPEHPPLA